jgi:hypothetical protein
MFPMLAFTLLVYGALLFSAGGAISLIVLLIRDVKNERIW